MATAKAATLLCLTLATGLGSWYLHARMPDHLWHICDEAGHRALERGQAGEAECLFAEAVKSARGFGAGDARLARSLFHQAQALEAQAKFSEALPLLEESAQIGQINWHMSSRETGAIRAFRAATIVKAAEIKR
jgi:hypothetical protein